VSVNADFRVDVRPYSGSVDPGFPQASYIAQASVVGDASGGQINISFLFQRFGDAQVSEMFNLEQLAMDSSVDNILDVTMRLFAMDTLAPQRDAFGQIWSLTLDGTAGNAGSALAEKGPRLPLWFGAPNREEGNGGLRFIMNNTDLELYAVTIQGYMWGPRSVMAPGGPQRPLGSLWG